MKIFPFNFDTYFSSDITCEIVTTNCRNGKAEYMQETSDRNRLMKICRASSSMPLACPIVNIEGIPYLDGGLADSIPVKRAQELGFEKIFLILTRPRGYRKSPTTHGMAQLYRRLYGKYPDLVKTCIRRNQIYNQSMAYIEELEAAGEIFVIRPQMTPVSRLEKDGDKLNVFYHHGYSQMKRLLPELLNYLNA